MKPSHYKGFYAHSRARTIQIKITSRGLSTKVYVQNLYNLKLAIKVTQILHFSIHKNQWHFMKKQLA